MDDVSTAPHAVWADVRSPSDRRTALVSGAPLNAPRSSGGAGGSAAPHYTCHNGFPRLHGENATANRNEHPSQTIATWSYLWIDTHTSDGASNWLPLGMVPRRPALNGRRWRDWGSDVDAWDDTDSEGEDRYVPSPPGIFSDIISADEVNDMREIMFGAPPRVFDEFREEDLLVRKYSSYLFIRTGVRCASSNLEI